MESQRTVQILSSGASSHEDASRSTATITSQISHVVCRPYVLCQLWSAASLI
jgi:hypothetical protein